MGRSQYAYTHMRLYANKPVCMAVCAPLWGGGRCSSQPRCSAQPRLQYAMYLQTCLLPKARTSCATRENVSPSDIKLLAS